jgi:hypothetical protein
MNYKTIYDSIIEYRKTQQPVNEYCETHHIIPKSIGGSNNQDNLVILTAREHFICHLLLVKIHENSQNYYKMVKAFFMMQTESKNQQRYISSRQYSRLKEYLAKIQSDSVIGNKNPNYGKVWCVPETAINCNGRKPFPKKSIPGGWITTNELKKKIKIKKIKEIDINKQKEMESKLTEWCNLYCAVGFTKFVELTGYQYSKPNLVRKFARWVPSFIPQNGKKR